jgi:hypothetical protein
MVTEAAIVFHESAGAVVMVEGRCLVLHRIDPSEWVFPKGHLEQVNVIRSSNSRPERIAVDDDWEGEWFLLFPVGIGNPDSITRRRRGTRGSARRADPADERRAD